MGDAEKPKDAIAELAALLKECGAKVTLYGQPVDLLVLRDELSAACNSAYLQSLADRAAKAAAMPTHNELTSMLLTLDAYAGSDAGDAIRTRIIKLAGDNVSRRSRVAAMVRERWLASERAEHILAMVSP